MRVNSTNKRKFFDSLNLYFPINKLKLQVFAGNIKSVLEEASESPNTTCNTGHTPTPVFYSSQ
jgi:hypothetical protein